MAKRYLYLDKKKNIILFETIQANHVSQAAVDKMVLDKTGTDPRLDVVNIERSICVVPDKLLDMVKN